MGTPGARDVAAVDRAVQHRQVTRGDKVAIVLTAHDLKDREARSVLAATLYPRTSAVWPPSLLFRCE